MTQAADETVVEWLTEL